MHHISLQLNQMRIKERFEQLSRTKTQANLVSDLSQLATPINDIQLDDLDDSRSDVPTELSRTISTLHETINQMTVDLPTSVEDIQQTESNRPSVRPTLVEMTEERNNRVKKIKRSSKLDVIQEEEPTKQPKPTKQVEEQVEEQEKVKVKRIKKPAVPKIDTESLYSTTAVKKDVKTEVSERLVIKRKPVKKVISATIATIAKN
jgi:hypothetical protein